MLNTATKEFISEIDALAADRRDQILSAKDTLEIKGTKYYVSNAGDDANDGLTPETAWATLKKVSDTQINEGDAVLFKRGDLEFVEFTFGDLLLLLRHDLTNLLLLVFDVAFV